MPRESNEPAAKDAMRYWRVHIFDSYSGKSFRSCRGAVKPSEAVAFSFWDMPVNEEGEEHVEMVHNEAGVRVLVREISYLLYREVELCEDPEDAEALLEEIDDLMSMDALSTNEAGEEAL